VAFSSDGKRLFTSSDSIKVWDMDTGQPLLDIKGASLSVNYFNIAFDALPTIPPGVDLKVQGANPGGPAMDAVVRLIDIGGVQERVYRLFAGRPDPFWHERQFDEAVTGKNFFAAVFHLNRLGAIAPFFPLLAAREHLFVQVLKQNPGDYLTLKLVARTVLTDPRAAADRKSLLTAFEKSPARPNALELRVFGGLLWRDGRPADAIKPLESAVALRTGDSPPVEELLLALAYHDWKKPAEAQRWLARATSWIDRYRQAMRWVNHLAAINGGMLPALSSLGHEPADPRYDPVQWETWHELETLRQEALSKIDSPKN
jgi:hypothetical protein